MTLKNWIWYVLSFFALIYASLSFSTMLIESVSSLLHTTSLLSYELSAAWIVLINKLSYQGKYHDAYMKKSTKRDLNPGPLLTGAISGYDR
jgi:hypothetical protein